MKSRVTMAWVALSGLLGFSGVARSQQAVAGRPMFSQSCPQATSGTVVAVHAPHTGAVLRLCEGHVLHGLSQGGHGQPLTLAAGDFDEDGVPDLLSGFANGDSGEVVLYRGNVDALWPYGAALRNGPPPAFLPDAHVFNLPERPDFLLTGDFDADGHWDIVAAKRGSNALYLLRGNGKGGFLAPERIALDGSITAILTGEINRRDGLTDLIVGLSTEGGAKALVYESPKGALRGQPEVIALPQPATAFALGRFDGNAMNDLAIAAGNQLLVVHARDRMLSAGASVAATVAPARVTQQELSFTVLALAAGDFTGAGPSIAALDENGTVHILEHALSEDSLLGRAVMDPGFQPGFQVAPRGGDSADSASMTISGTLAPSMAARFAALRQTVRANASFQSAGSVHEWTERNAINLPSGFSHQAPALVVARVSGSKQDDLLITDSGNSKIHVLSNAAAMRIAHAAAMTNVSVAVPVQPLALMDSLDATSSPVAVLPMRLNQHGLNGLVTLHEGQSAPALTPHAVNHIYTVTNTSDITAVGQTAPDGSLRAAMTAAGNACYNSGDTCSIVFNIPTTDPNYNPADGSFLIRPLSENVPNSGDAFALPPINATITIDGYTQPGASPNTLTNGDNAKILIQIDGSRATTPGGTGLVPFDDNGSVFRGLAFTGWTNTASNGNGSVSGAEGIEANGVGDFIEGNFFGTDVTGTISKPDRIGIFADNGPLFGSAPGNIIGGSTPQARNLLSGNNVGGILFLSTAYEAQLQGNFIGTDITGTKPLGNSYDGAGLNGPTVAIGGTLPGTANVISGNGTNVDINDLTNGGAAKNSVVQGNLIGTDPTGAKAVTSNSGSAVSILSGPQSMTIGGTTPAARNIISGSHEGVYIFNDTFNNIVQGNYIGTDITGTKAVPNLNQGVTIGATTSTSVPADFNTIGGAVPGAGNVISGNTTDGIAISGHTNGSNALPGNVILGNYIGTDATGANPIANGGNGIHLGSAATNVTIGATTPGSGNLISNNKLNGVLIDASTTTSGQGVNNNTIANTILSNGGAGVRVASGTKNRISQNSIFSNGALGIDLDIAGPNTNSHCNATTNGANGLQNYPVLTAGSGTAYITATATDPNGNTSEFSKAVQASVSGNLLSLLGTFDGVANTAYAIEFFSSPTPDASGYGQGKTYLGSTIVTTGADCTISISDPVDTTKADVSVNLSTPVYSLSLGPDFGMQVYTGNVVNNGPATAHNVVFTDTLPDGLQLSGAYCNVGPCQTPVTSTLGACTVSGKTITCNFGTMPVGATASVNIPVQATLTGDISDTATVQATEPDPNTANNTSTLTKSSSYPYAAIDHLSPTTALAGSKDLLLTVYGLGFGSFTSITFNNTTLPIAGVYDNQVCGSTYSPSFCTGLQVIVPAAMLTTAGSYTVTAINPGGSYPLSATFKVAASCDYSSTYSSFGSSPIGNEGTTLIPQDVYVYSNVSSCPYTVTSSVPWAVVLDNASGTGNATVDVAIAPNPDSATRTGTITVAGQTITFQQSGGATCSYTLDSSTVPFGQTGGNASVNITASSSSCSYFIDSYASWITVAKNSGLLVGSGTASYTVAANSGPPRTGTIMIGGTVLTINQAAASCYFTIDTTSAQVPTGGGSGSINVTANSPSCPWTATSSDSTKLSVTSGASGTGNGTVKYTVPANTGGPQTPTITIGNGTASAVFTVNQSSAYACTFALTPASTNISVNGTTNVVSLTASFSFCKWVASSNNPDAVTITTAASGTGSGGVYFTVGQNTGPARTLTITAGCQTFTIHQDGIASNNPTPTITALQPSSANAGSGAFTLSVTGTNFVDGAVVNFNGNARTTTFGSATQVTAGILASDVASAGTVPVTVTNPTPGGGTSNSLNFTIVGTNNPTPALTSLQPSSATAGSGAFTLTVNGTNFVTGAVVNFNGNARTTTFVSATQVTAAILASDVANAGTVPVTVTNPTPGGGTSNSLNFTINSPSNPVPAITTLQPSSVVAASGAFTLTVNGSNFISSSVVNFNSSARATTYVSATQLTAAILASDVANTGTAAVTVTNPAPGGGTSNSVSFSITTPPAPQATLNPTGVTFSAVSGTTSAAQTITLANGGNAPLSITSIAITGTNASAFAQTNNCGSSLAAGANCAISVTFTPSSVASFTATLSVTDNASGSPQTATLNGTGTNPPSFTISSSGAQTVLRGGTAVYTITVASQNGTFSNAITLSAGGLPSGATATFTPASVTPGNSSATSQLSVQVPSNLAMNGRNSALPLLASLLPLLGLLFAKRPRRWVKLAALVLCATAVASLAGCAGGFTIPSRSYSLTITGTSGQQQQSTTVQLTVR